MEKKNTGLVVLVIILSLLVVGLGGYIVYDKVLSDKDADNNCNDSVDVENNNNIVKNKMDYEGFIQPSEHVEIDENIKHKLIEVFNFVYNYNKSKYYGNYCVGATDTNDTIVLSNVSDGIYRYNVASTEYSSFKEMMDYLKTYMTPNVIYNTDSSGFSINFKQDDFYFEREYLEKFNNYKCNANKILSDTLKKHETRMKNIDAKLEECKEMEKYRIYGELITANLYRLNNNHVTTIELENYYDNNNLISIPLDIKYTPNINAKRYFKKYSKLKNALKIVSVQKEETEAEIDYIESIKFELEQATKIEDLQNIIDEINENVIFKNKFKKKNNINSKEKDTFSLVQDR